MKSRAYEHYSVLHKMPELAMHEYQTSTYIAQQLYAAGITVKKNINGSTGVIGIIPGKQTGPIIVLRADMDALPYDINGNPYVKHGCGHDANASMVLTAGEAIAREGGLPRGELRLLFQPAEETLVGAKAIIASGEIYDADIIVGIHLRPMEEAKLHEATPALCHGASSMLLTTIRGKHAHGARPHLGINAIDAAMLAINAVNAIHIDPKVPYSVKATRIQSFGQANNTIPDCVKIWFDLRCQTQSGIVELLGRVENALNHTVNGIGATCESIEQVAWADAAEYDPELVQIAKESIKSILGSTLPPMYTIGSEDFHFYHTLMGKRTVYIGLGADMTSGLHCPDMTFDPAALDDGVAILTDFLKRACMK